VYLEMDLHITSFSKPLRTAWESTLIGLLTGMSMKVDLESRRPCKSGLTYTTFKRPYVKVSLHVVLEMSVSLEALSATFEVTGERLLACMDSHMGLEVTLLVELLVADSTSEGFISSLKG
jgi:hypothetical protein